MTKKKTLKKHKTPQFMYKDFEEYAEIMKMTPAHPNYEAFKIIWDMARTPGWVLSELSKKTK